MRTINYKPVMTMSIYAEDAYFDIFVEQKYVRCNAMDLNPMCDAYNVYNIKQDEVRITVKPTDKFHNYFEDYETLTVELPVELGRQVIAAIRDEEDDKMWFTKDRLCYAAKYGKVL